MTCGGYCGSGQAGVSFLDSRFSNVKHKATSSQTDKAEFTGRDDCGEWRREEGRFALQTLAALRGFCGRRVSHRHRAIMNDGEELIGGYDPLVEEFER